MSLKVIETRYAGCHFRSRTEARWAVFFDAMGIKWEYEKEGYELPSGWYLPDFWLPELNWLAWLEVKPYLPNTGSIEMKKCQELADLSGLRVYLVGGIPSLDEHYLFALGERHNVSMMGLPGFAYGLEAARSARFEHGQSGRVTTHPLCSEWRREEQEKAKQLEEAIKYGINRYGDFWWTWMPAIQVLCDMGWPGELEDKLLRHIKNSRGNP
jgi:hypothetical protein